MLKYQKDNKRKEKNMLKLKDIKKDYMSGDTIVQALKGINIEK